MADTTISQLSQGTPAGNDILPYSTGSSTLGVPVSAIFQNTNTYVAIGSSISAQYKLDVYHDNYNAIRAVGNSTNSIGIYIDNKAPGARSYGIGSVGSSGPSKAGNLTIFDHTAQLPRFNIDSTGNVGIGVNDPQAKLDVSGTIKATGLQVPGCVLQVVQAYKTDIWKPTLVSSWEDVTGLSVSITLKSATSKVLINTSVAASRGGDGNDAFVRIVRVTGSAETAVGGGSKPNSPINNVFGQVAGQFSGAYQSYSLSTMYLDTPAGATSTYKIQFYNGAAGTAKVNCRALLDDMIVASHITLQEIAQ